MSGYVNIEEIIKKKQINTHFLPIISPVNKKIIGVESLSRGVSDSGNIMPTLLFERGEEENMVLELDKLCREKAIVEYEKKYKKYSDKLFLNFNVSTLDSVGIVGVEHLEYIAKKSGIEPSNICIEFTENSVKNTSNLQKFVNIFRKYGFLIALDNLGKFEFNKERILLLKPDILKIDRSVVSDLNKQAFKQEIFKSIKSIANRIGAETIATGTETDEDSIMAIHLGADYLQGFFFGETKENPDLDTVEIKADYLYNIYFDLLQKKHQITNSYNTVYKNIFIKVIDQVKINGVGKINENMTTYFDKTGIVKNIYVVNENGVIEYDIAWNGILDKNIFVKERQKGLSLAFTDFFINAVYKKDEIVISSMYITQYDKKLSMTMASCISLPISLMEIKKVIVCMDISMENIRSSEGTGLMISDCI